MTEMTSLSSSKTAGALARLEEANSRFAAAHPGETGERQPIHVVYGGAHLFKAGTARKLGALAVRLIEEYAPDAAVFAEALELPGAEASTVHARVLGKLGREPLEDFHIDFEDGYGFRPDEEEDLHAAASAAELAKGLEAGLLPPFMGIRVKSFSPEFYRRSARTLDVFVTAMAAATRGALPGRFVVTLPKVTIPEQVSTLAELLGLLEAANGLPEGSLKIEVMIETTQSIFAPDGRTAVRALTEAARGRCVAVQFGPYDYTAGCSITSAHRHMVHPASDFARHVMQVSLAGTGIELSDGGTNVMPIPPHKAGVDGSLSAAQRRENREVVHHAWKVHYDHIRHSLAHGYYQGGDLHPGQLIPRYAATYAYFLESFAEAAARLRNFVDKAARATMTGNVFDDAATGQGLLNFFLRAFYCGALTEEEVRAATGLGPAELRCRSFAKIVAGKGEPNLVR